MANEPNIRNRVAGAVVLVSLAVIFLPLILDGKKKNQILESYIPEKPQTGEIILIDVDESLNSAQQQEPDTTQDEAPTDAKETLTIPVDEIIQTDTPVKKEPEVNTEPETKSPPVIQTPKPVTERDNRPNFKTSGFLVQMGSFGSETNAQALVNKMRAANHRAYYKAGQAGGKRIFRVFSGPYSKRPQAESALTSLRSLANVSPIIVTYDPLKHAQ